MYRLAETQRFSPHHIKVFHAVQKNRNIKIWTAIIIIITYPVTPDCGEHQRVSLLTVPVKLNSKQRLTVILLQRTLWYCYKHTADEMSTSHLTHAGYSGMSRDCTGQRLVCVLTLRLLTHLKEYLHFLDFHLPFPQLFLPGALAVLVGVSGRSALVPLSTLTASSCHWKNNTGDV